MRKNQQRKRISKIVSRSGLSADKTDSILTILSHLNDSSRQFISVEGEQGSGKTSTIEKSINASRRWYFSLALLLWLVFLFLFWIFDYDDKIKSKIVKYRKPKILEINLWAIFDGEKDSVRDGVEDGLSSEMKKTVWRTILFKLGVFKHIRQIFILTFELKILKTQKKIVSWHILLALVPLFIAVAMVLLNIFDINTDWKTTVLPPIISATMSIFAYFLMKINLENKEEELFKGGFDNVIVRDIVERKSKWRKIIIHVFDLDRIDKNLHYKILKEFSLIYKSKNVNILFETTQMVLDNLRSGLRNKTSSNEYLVNEEFNKIVPAQTKVKSLTIDGLKSIINPHFIDLEYQMIYPILESSARKHNLSSFRNAKQYEGNYSKITQYLSTKNSILDKDFLLNSASFKILEIPFEFATRKTEDEKIFFEVQKNSSEKWDAEIFYNCDYSKTTELVETLNSFQNLISIRNFIPENHFLLTNREFFDLINHIELNEFETFMPIVHNGLEMIMTSSDGNVFLSNKIFENISSEEMINMMVKKRSVKDAIFYVGDDQVVLSFFTKKIELRGKLIQYLEEDSNAEKKYAIISSLLSRESQQIISFDNELFKWLILNSKSFTEIRIESLSDSQRNIYEKTFENNFDSSENIVNLIIASILTNKEKIFLSEAIQKIGFEQVKSMLSDFDSVYSQKEINFLNELVNIKIQDSNKARLVEEWLIEKEYLKQLKSFPNWGSTTLLFNIFKFGNINLMKLNIKRIHDLKAESFINGESANEILRITMSDKDLLISLLEIFIKMNDLEINDEIYAFVNKKGYCNDQRLAQFGLVKIDCGFKVNHLSDLSRLNEEALNAGAFRNLELIKKGEQLIKYANDWGVDLNSNPTSKELQEEVQKIESEWLTILENDRKILRRTLNNIDEYKRLTTFVNKIEKSKSNYIKNEIQKSKIHKSRIVITKSRNNLFKKMLLDQAFNFEELESENNNN